MKDNGNKEVKLHGRKEECIKEVESASCIDLTSGSDSFSRECRPLIKMSTFPKSFGYSSYRSFQNKVSGIGKIQKKVLGFNENLENPPYQKNETTSDTDASGMGNYLEEYHGVDVKALKMDDVLQIYENDELLQDYEDLRISPVFFHEGISLLKVSHKSKKRVFFRIAKDFLEFSLSNLPSSCRESLGLTKKIASTATHPYKYKSYEFSNSEINSIYYGTEAKNYREELHISKEFEERWLTLIFYYRKKKRLKTLHFIADSKHDLKKIKGIITDFQKLREHLAKSTHVYIYEVEAFMRNIVFEKYLEGSEKRYRQYLEFHDILKYSKRLNMNVNTNYLKSIFDTVRVESSNQCLDLQQFKEFISIIKKRRDIILVWGHLFNDREFIGYLDFKRFMYQTQHEKYLEETLAKIFRKFCTANGTWSWESLNSLLLSKYSNPIKTVSDESYYEHPLNEYFISSSHNTYLIGRQVADNSSIDGYIRALQRGCRSVEIDIWDGLDDDENEKPSNEPVVKHGRTFTTTISLRNVLKTIKSYSFVTSSYPVIISLEVHCSDENQLKVVKCLKEILGNALILQPLEKEGILPSPNQLRHKFLVKVRKTSPFTELTMTESGSYISSSTSTTTSVSEDNGIQLPNRKRFSMRKRPQSKKIIEELSSLGVYAQGLKFKNFSLPESKTFNHCFSFNENTFNSMLKDEVKLASIVKHNKRFLMRVYPSKMRMNSTNFMPIKYWTHGVQLVATNWQTFDLGQQINRAFFKGSNYSGYVLKPKYMCTPQTKFSPKQIPTRTQKCSFNIEIISGHQLPKPKGKLNAINPYVSLEIIGADEVLWDSRSEAQKTSIVQENGLNPIWSASFSGKIILRTDLVFIRFLVCTSARKNDETNSDINPLAILVFKLFDLKKGYRYIPLDDFLGEELIYSSLFVKIEYDDICL